MMWKRAEKCPDYVNGISRTSIVLEEESSCLEILQKYEEIMLSDDGACMLINNFMTFIYDDLQILDQPFTFYRRKVL